VLDDCLPDDVASQVSGCCSVAMVAAQGSTPLSWWHCKPHTVDTFHDKQDVIEACLASMQLPLLVDGRLTASYRGHPMIDAASIGWIAVPVDGAVHVSVCPPHGVGPSVLSSCLNRPGAPVHAHPWMIPAHALELPKHSLTQLTDLLGVGLARGVHERRFRMGCEAFDAWRAQDPGDHLQQA
jgi:hypothetical protein